MKITNFFYKKIPLRKRIAFFSILFLFSFGYSNPVYSNSWKEVSIIDEMTNKKEIYYTRTIRSGIHKFVTKLTCNIWELNGYTEIEGKNKGLRPESASTFNDMVVTNLNLDGKYIPGFLFFKDMSYSNSYYVNISNDPNIYPIYGENGEDAGTSSKLFSSKTVKIQFPIRGYGQTIFTLKNEIDPWIKLQPYCKN